MYKSTAHRKIHSPHTKNHLKRCRIPNYARGNMYAAWSVANVCFVSRSDWRFPYSSSKQRKTAFSTVSFVPIVLYSGLKIYTFSPSIVLRFYTFVVLFVWFLDCFFYIYNVTHSLTVLRVCICFEWKKKRLFVLSLFASLNVQHFLPCILHIALQMCHLWEKAGNGKAGVMVERWECELL